MAPSNVLNPTLYDRLETLFGPVRVSKAGEPFVAAVSWPTASTLASGRSTLAVPSAPTTATSTRSPGAIWLATLRAVSTEIVTATLSLPAIAAASVPPPPSEGERNVESVMNCRAWIVEDATFPASCWGSVTAENGTEPSSEAGAELDAEPELEVEPEPETEPEPAPTNGDWGYVPMSEWVDEIE